MSILSSTNSRMSSLICRMVAAADSHSVDIRANSRDDTGLDDGDHIRGDDDDVDGHQMHVPAHVCPKCHRHSDPCC